MMSHFVCRRRPEQGPEGEEREERGEHDQEEEGGEGGEEVRDQQNHLYCETSLVLESRKLCRLPNIDLVLVAS